MNFEITDEVLVPDELCTVTVTMPADVWSAICRDRITVDASGGKFALWSISGQFGNPLPRTPSLSLIGEALAKPCGKCEGTGTKLPFAEEYEDREPCSECAGSGHASVPGVRLAERGSHVEIR